MIFCEGIASEPDYINGIKKVPEIATSVAINIEIEVRHGVPMTLVKRAIDRKKDPEIDECWCVFDVEWPKNHPNLKQAVILAREHGIGLAISNPFFELWLILHFEAYAKFSDTATVERRSRQLDGRAGKRIDPTTYMPHRKEAMDRALALSSRHTQDGTVFPQDNPSSSMAELLISIDSQVGQGHSLSTRPSPAG